MNLLRTTLLSALQTAVKMLSNFIILKVVAIYSGPTGVAIIGQFQSFIQMLTAIATAPVSTAMVRYTSELRSNLHEKKKLFHAGMWLSVGITVLVSSSVFLLKDKLSLWLFGSGMYEPIFLFFALSCLFFVFNAFLLSILNGEHRIGEYITANIANSLFVAILTYIFSLNYGIFGALAASTCAQALSFFVTLSFFRRQWLSSIFLPISGWKNTYIKTLLGFSLMTVVSALVSPLSQIIIRDFIATHISWEAAGDWQGVWRISEAYLSIVTLSLSVYYLPKLTKLQQYKEIKREVYSVARMCLPFVIASSFGIFLLRDYIIVILFSTEFYGMRTLFLYQLIGDFFKIFSWLYAYILLAKSQIKWFIGGEFLAGFVFVGFAMWLAKQYGVIGVTYAFLLSYIIYFIYVFYAVRHTLGKVTYQEQLENRVESL